MIIKELTPDNSLNSSKIAPNFYEEVFNCFQEFKTLWHRLQKYAQNVQPTWGTTLAEGVALHQLPQLSDRLLPEIVNVIFGVTESEIIAAICYLWENCQLKAEASAVLPIAAYLANPSFFSRYQQVYFFITGGNIEDDLFHKILRGNVTQ
ncbi:MULTISPECIES: hypothetical protein [Spirulina sp. CCY15215]|uniref:hypothetical protein n=1 Tax=Spirulina sp. CCY15215 TaxID=2767591 RepID=UPI001950EA1C|nr:hypothetical protein [Spirulina major]